MGEPLPTSRLYITGAVRFGCHALASPQLLTAISELRSHPDLTRQIMGKLSRRCSIAPPGRGSAATSILGFLRRLRWESEVCTPCAWQTSSHGRAESGVWACAASRQLRRTVMPPLLAVETEPDDAIFQTAQMKHSFGTEASVSLDEHRSSSEVRGCRKRGVERCRMMGFIQEGGGP